MERRPAGSFDAGLLAHCAEVVAELTASAAPELATVPGHDAISLARICPAAMLVVPSVGGVCHSVSALGQALTAAGADRAPAHADGTVSNIMLHEDGGVRLVDFDCAGMTDPRYDFGVVLNEACADEAAWHAGLEAAFGATTQRDLARCRAYAIADDLLWGL